MAKRGRPPLKRAPEDRILQNGLTVRQDNWLKRGWERRGFASAAHYLRYIVSGYIERVESRSEEDRFTPKGIERERREQSKSGKSPIKPK